MIELDFESGYQRNRPRGVPAFLCFKGKAPKQKQSAEEIQNNKNNIAMHQRYMQAFRPLEEEQIKSLESFDANKREDLAGGRSNADIAQAERQNMEANRAGLRAAGVDLTSDRAMMDQQDTADAISEAHNKALLDSKQSARDSVDAERMGLINTGRDKQSQTSAGLRAMADIGNKAALAKLNTNMFKHESKMQLIGQAAGAATGLGAMKYMKMKPATGGDTTTAANVPAPPTSISRNNAGLGAFRSAAPAAEKPYEFSWNSGFGVPKV